MQLAASSQRRRQRLPGAHISSQRSAAPQDTSHAAPPAQPTVTCLLPLPWIMQLVLAPSQVGAQSFSVQAMAQAQPSEQAHPSFFVHTWMRMQAGGGAASGGGGA